MHSVFGAKSNEIPGPSATVDCLWCGKQATAASTRQRTEWLMLFHLIPILRLRTIFVRCGACAQDMVAKCSLEEVARDNPMILRDLLVKRISFVGKVCIVLGLLLCWAPLIGVLPATIGFFYRNAYGRLMKAMSYIGLIISWLITGSLAILSVLSKH